MGERYGAEYRMAAISLFILFLSALFPLKGTSPLEASLIDVEERQFEIEGHQKRVSIWWLPGLWLDSTAGYAQVTPSRQPIRFTWQKVNAAEKYQLQMSTIYQFTDIQIDQIQTALDYVWTNPAPGYFFWRVRAIQADQTHGIWSAIGRIEVLVSPPRSKSPKIFKYTRWSIGTKPPLVKLRWKSSKWAKSYELQTSPKTEFHAETLTAYLPKTAEQKVRFSEDGTYFWRVRGLTEDQKPLGRFSKPYSLEIRGISPPIRTPANSEVVDQSITEPVESAPETEKETAPVLPIKKNIRKWKAEKVGVIRYGMGLGTTYIDYEERRRSNTVNLQQIGITLKPSASLLLSPSWELSASGFFTLVPFQLTGEPEGLGSARFYGINSRVGYRLTSEDTDNSLWIHTGWYFLGTLIGSATPELVYGVEAMNGPQFLMNYRLRTGHGRSASIYAKIAFIQNATGFSLSDREWAFGGSYPISNKISATVDVSRLNYQTFDLNTYSLGAAYRF
jgi:hypothetical protein